MGEKFRSSTMCYKCAGTGQRTQWRVFPTQDFGNKNPYLVDYCLRCEGKGFTYEATDEQRH